MIYLERMADNPAQMIVLIVLIVLAVILFRISQRDARRIDYDRKRIYRHRTSRGSTVILSRPLGEDEGYGK